MFKFDLRQLSLNSNAYKVMPVFFIFSGQNWMKIIIFLQAVRFKLNCHGLSQTCLSLKSIMQLSKTIFPDSAIFIEKTRVENLLWGKNEFLWGKINVSFGCHTHIVGVLSVCNKKLYRQRSPLTLQQS